MALAQQSEPERGRWERMTLDQIREMFGDDEVDAGLERLYAKGRASADQCRAAGHPVVDQD